MTTHFALRFAGGFLAAALVSFGLSLAAAAQMVTEFPLPTPGSGPVGITAGADGNLWFTEFFTNTIGRITPAGQITEFKIPSSGRQPSAITAGPDGNLWWVARPSTSPAVSSVGRITPDGVITEFLVSDVPLDITAGPDGNIWFTQLGFVDKIGRITPAGVVTQFTLPSSNGATGIATGADGNLWYTEQIPNMIGRLTPTGVISRFPVPTPGGRPFGITAGPDGNVWFVWFPDTGAAPSKVSRVTPEGVITEFPLPPGFRGNQITTGPDGNLWVTDHGHGGIACVTPEGVICAIVQPPTSGSGLHGITTGPDGNLWFAEQIGNRIGRFNPEERATVAFSAATYAVNEDTAAAAITVVRTGRLSVPFTVRFTTAPLSAVAGRDFTAVSGQLTFPTNATTRTFVVPVLDNMLVTGDRTVLLTLETPEGGAVLGAVATATLTIREIGRPGTLQLDAPAYAVQEGAGSVQITIRRSGTQLAGDVSVDFATVDGPGAQGAVAGRNYIGTAGRVTFGPGDTGHTVMVPILRDGVVTGPLTFTFGLANPTSGAILGVPSAGTVVISDEDRAGIVEFAMATSRVSQTGGEVKIPVLRRNGASGGVTVDFETRDGTAKAGIDYARASGTLTFAANQSTAFITVAVMDHRRRTGDRTFSAVLTRASGGTLGSRTRTNVTIVDDHAVLELSGRAVKNGLEVLRTGSLTAHVTVHYRALDGTAARGVDYDVGDGILAFPPGVRSAFIPVQALGDNIAEGRETFTIELFDPSPPAILGRGSSRVFGILDNDFGGTVSFSRASSTALRGATHSVTIVRQGGLGTVLTINWAAIGGSAVAMRDFSPAAGSVTFGPQDTSRTFTVDIAGPDVGQVPDRTIVFGVTFPAGAARLGGVRTSIMRIPGRSADGSATK